MTIGFKKLAQKREIDPGGDQDSDAEKENPEEKG